MRLKGDVKYMTCLKSNMSIFRQFVHERELKRRREDENLEQRVFWGCGGVRHVDGWNRFF